MDSERFDEVSKGEESLHLFRVCRFQICVGTSIDRLWIDFGRYVKRLFSERADLVDWIIKENVGGYVEVINAS